MSIVVSDGVVSEKDPSGRIDRLPAVSSNRKEPDRLDAVTGYTVEVFKSREVYTTGQVAKICKVAPRTVSKWFDSGRLRGFRIPGGSWDRRIPREHLLSFLKNHGMPLPREEDHWMILGFSEGAARELEGRGYPFVARELKNSFDAGILVSHHQPAVCLLNLPEESPEHWVPCFSHLQGNGSIVIAAVSDAATAEVLKPYCSDVFQKPCDFVLMCARADGMLKKKLAAG